MITHYGLTDLHIDRPVVTIGSFDGVHQGHCSVINALIKETKSLDGESVIITFEPHPREVLYPLERGPGILTTLEEKIVILDRMGVDHLVVLTFTKELGELAYADFVKTILVDKIKVKGLVVGYDHRFGKGRAGNFDNLKQLAERYGFVLKQMPVFETNDVNVSSTKIRKALADGDIEKVNAFLGYSYSLTGTVVHGKKIGRKIGFPTANLKVNDKRKFLPAPGVYIVTSELDGTGVFSGSDSSDMSYDSGRRKFWGLLNIGVKPTVSTKGELSSEVYFLDFDGDLYGKTVTVSLLDRLRDEHKFENISELQSQLERDTAELRHRLSAEH